MKYSIVMYDENNDGDDKYWNINTNWWDEKISYINDLNFANAQLFLARYHNKTRSNDIQLITYSEDADREYAKKICERDKITNELIFEKNRIQKELDKLKKEYTHAKSAVKAERKYLMEWIAADPFITIFKIIEALRVRMDEEIGAGK